MAQADRTSDLTAAAAGDELAFRRLIADHHDDMRRVCSYVTRDEGIADEATQAAWSIAWRKLDTVRDQAALRPWLVSVAVNEAKQLIRKRRRRAELEVVADPAGEPGGTDPATGIDLVDMRMALERLDPDDRALLAMRFIAGFDSTELAAAIGISPSGVRSRIERIRARLQQELGDD